MRAHALSLLAFMAAACGEPEPLARGEAGRVWSGHAFDLETAEGVVPVVLAGVTGPNRELHPEAADATRGALLDRVGPGLQARPASDPETDRYGRMIAAVTTSDGDLAESLVRAGWLIVWPREGQTLDFGPLYAAEADARAEGRGGWGAGAFAISDTDPDRLAQRLDGPVIVQGRVVATGEARDGRVFVNFGLDWRSDFTATADRNARTRFEEAEIDLYALEGAVVRVRGWLYAYNGPAIELSHPAQIEILDAPDGRALPR
ncbi:MAG: hypothetical protein ABL308_07305 [Oceanicaulis sp.]